MRTLISPEAYEHHVTLYGRYLDRIATGVPADPRDRNAAILHERYFQTIREPSPMTEGGLLWRRLEKEYGSLSGLNDRIVELSSNPDVLWVVLAADPWEGDLFLQATGSHGEAPLCAAPIMALDLWEHAYWMDWGSDRDAYVRQFLTAVNWRWVEDQYTAVPKFTRGGMT